ncbi:MAG: PEP-CTERM sorting domain-containing protein, partial [Planctomycetota bacterium]
AVNCSFDLNIHGPADSGRLPRHSPVSQLSEFGETMTRFTTSLIAATAALSIAGAASAQVLINDEFDRTTSAGSWGSTSGIDYLTGSDTQTPFVDGSVGNFGGGSSLTLAADLAPLAPTGYTVSYTANRNIAGGGFIAFFVGTGTTDTGALVFDITTAAADYGVLIQQNNDAAGELLANIFVAGTATPFALPGSDNSAEFDVEIAVDAPDGYDAGDAGTVSLTVNGTFLGSEAVTFDGVSSGVATLSSNIGGDSATLDNLVVAIPEPASLGLLGLGGLALLRRRK